MNELKKVTTMIKKRARSYISDIDKFLSEFDNTHPLSASQLAEINKYKNIIKLRDQPQEDLEDNKKII